MPTTEELARRLGLRPQTLRAALCRNGHYFGLRPAKLPNGHLLWPADSFERLIGRESV
ncbi:MAG: helix-turn-helix domain-containing protein [Proteobacteria bacterium]|nr:helix-turn-helix domain-containing protein [Pseudomonadota bacterium]